MSLLKLPTQKILAKYLLRCVEETNEGSTKTEGGSSSVSSWRCQVADLNFPISPAIWVQGIVVEIFDSGSKVCLDDGSGIIILSNCDTVAIKVLIQKGMYLMAVGALQSVGQHPVIKPFKLQNLSGDHVAEIMWPLEVLDQIAYNNLKTKI